MRINSIAHSYAYNFNKRPQNSIPKQIYNNSAQNPISCSGNIKSERERILFDKINQIKNKGENLYSEYMSYANEAMSILNRYNSNPSDSDFPYSIIQYGELTRRNAKISDSNDEYKYSVQYDQKENKINSVSICGENSETTALFYNGNISSIKAVKLGENGAEIKLYSFKDGKLGAYQNYLLNKNIKTVKEELFIGESNKIEYKQNTPAKTPNQPVLEEFYEFENGRFIRYRFRKLKKN